MAFPTKKIRESLIALLNRIKVITWFEVFEKWFGFGVKLLWITLFITFGIYLNKEYKKDIYYLNDFKVPASWVEKGYTGDVVKEAIIDEIDVIRQQSAGFYQNGKLKSTRNKDGDNTEFLTDISVEGFNLKAVMKSAMALLGKKNRTIGGYVTLSDSAQTIAVQITDQMTTKVKVSRKDSIPMLIHKATLQIMRVKRPITLLSYYMRMRDTLEIFETERYVKQNREAINDDDFFISSSSLALFKKDYADADIWADSMLLKFPNDMYSYLLKAKVASFRMYYDTKDSVTKAKLGRSYLDYSQKAIEHDKIGNKLVPVGEVYFDMAGYYIQTGNAKVAKEYLDKANKLSPLTAMQNNGMAYYFMSVKDYKEAEKYLQRATKTEPSNGDYWDSLGELYSLQGKDSLAIVYLQKALFSLKKSATVSKKAYQKDPRWVKIAKRKDFKKLLL